MATITSASSGNFSDTATWVGGVVPGAGDDAVAATGHVVVIDFDVTVLSFQQTGTGKFTLGDGRNVTGDVIANAGTFTSGGTVDVICGVGESATINGNVTGVSSTAVNVAGVVVSGVGSLTLNGDVTGSAGNASSEANGHAGVFTDVACTITINGNVSGGSGAHKRGLQAGALSGAVSLTVIGDLSSGSGVQTYGVFNTGASATVTVTATTVQGGSGTNTQGINNTGASATVTVTATTVQGGAANGAHGINNIGASATVTVTATTVQGGGINISHGINNTGASATVTTIGTTQGGGGSFAYGINNTGASATVTTIGTTQGGGGTIAHGINNTGGSSTTTVIGEAIAGASLQHGILSTATANGVIFTGDITDSPTGTVAISTRLFRITDTSPSGVTTYANTAGFPSGTPVSRVSADLVIGMAQEVDVRLNTVYGFNSELTGQLAVPPPQSVAAGVPTDNTVGTGGIDQANLVAVIGAQIAAASSTPSVP
jgi:hypothetical protein